MYTRGGAKFVDLQEHEVLPVMDGGPALYVMPVADDTVLQFRNAQFQVIS